MSRRRAGDGAVAKAGTYKARTNDGKKAPDRNAKDPLEGLRSRLGATPAPSSMGHAPLAAKESPSTGGSRRATPTNRAAVNSSVRSGREVPAP